jgi:hypothetical protein
MGHVTYHVREALINILKINIAKLTGDSVKIVTIYLGCIIF